MSIIAANLSTPEAVLPLRTRHRTEMNCQIVHDSIHRREGWTRPYLLDDDGDPVGFGTIAIAGPWKDKPTVFEFYVLPEHRTRSFDLFEVFLATSGARFFEVQSNDTVLTVLVHSFGLSMESEKIVFDDKITTAHPSNGASLRCVT